MKEDEDYEDYYENSRVVYSELNPWVTWGRAFGLVGVVFVLVWGLRSCYIADQKHEIEKMKIDAKYGAYYENGAKNYRGE
ncbi:hypothetical protein D3C81_767780 [compost metagenome]